MKITLHQNGWVDLGDEKGGVHSLTLEQYEKHARDPEFVAAIPAASHAEVMAARTAQLEAAVNAALDAAAGPKA